MALLPTTKEMTLKKKNVCNFDFQSLENSLKWQQLKVSNFLLLQLKSLIILTLIRKIYTLSNDKNDSTTTTTRQRFDNDSTTTTTTRQQQQRLDNDSMTTTTTTTTTTRQRQRLQRFRLVT